MEKIIAGLVQIYCSISSETLAVSLRKKVIQV